MKKAYGFLTLAVLLLAQPVLAQQFPSVGVYFDEEGTQTTAFLNGGPPWYWNGEEDPRVYVIAYLENLVGGAAFKLDVYPEIFFQTPEYPVGVQVGDPLSGVEIGLYEPQLGFFHQPVLMATISMYLPEVMDFARLNVIPHPNYPAVMISDHLGNLFPAIGLSSWLTVPVPNEDSTWGAVKDLFH